MIPGRETIVRGGLVAVAFLALAAMAYFKTKSGSLWPFYFAFLVPVFLMAVYITWLNVYNWASANSTRFGLEGAKQVTPASVTMSYAILSLSAIILGLSLLFTLPLPRFSWLTATMFAVSQALNLAAFFSPAFVARR